MYIHKVNNLVVELMLTCSFKLFSMAFRGSNELTDSLKCDRGPFPAVYSPLLGLDVELKSYWLFLVLLYEGGPFIIDPLAMLFMSGGM